jgi:hypothetical protein
MTFHIGQRLRYSKPEPGEETLTFVLIEDNGDRLLIESRDFPDAMIAPREVVLASDVAPVVPPYATRKALRDATLAVGRNAS